jgi:hypothetical protein
MSLAVASPQFPLFHIGWRGNYHAKCQVKALRWLTHDKRHIIQSLCPGDFNLDFSLI